MKNYITIALILVIITCIKLRSTGNYKYALNEDGRLFVEVYRSGLTGNLRSEYLTDSAKFRIYLGTYNDKKLSVRCQLQGDIITVEKRSNSSLLRADAPKIIERRIYSLTDLKKRRDFY